MIAKLNQLEENPRVKIVLQLIGIIMSIVSIVSVAKGYTNFKDSVHNIDFVTNNWKTVPYVDIQIVKAYQNCPTGYSVEPIIYFPGISAGSCAVNCLNALLSDCNPCV